MLTKSSMFGKLEVHVLEVVWRFEQRTFYINSLRVKLIVCSKCDSIKHYVVVCLPSPNYWCLIALAIYILKAGVEVHRSKILGEWGNMMIGYELGSSSVGVYVTTKDFCSGELQSWKN